MQKEIILSCLFAAALITSSVGQENTEALPSAVAQSDKSEMVVTDNNKRLQLQTDLNAIDILLMDITMNDVPTGKLENDLVMARIEELDALRNWKQLQLDLVDANPAAIKERQAEVEILKSEYEAFSKKREMLEKEIKSSKKK